MSHDTDADGATMNRAETTIPQDTSTGVFDLAFGLTFGELALVVAPPAVMVGLYIRFFDALAFLPGRGVFFAILSSGLLSAYLVLKAPDHISPRELAAREVGGVLAQIRMPIGAEAAREVPGVVDDHPEADVVERTDGAQVAVIHVPAVNLSQADDVDKEAAAVDLAARVDQHLSKTDTPAKVRLRRRHTADVSEQVRDLRDPAGSPTRGQVGFAADHANANVRTAVDEGVCDLDVFVETWVRPGEVAAEADTTRLDRFASSSRVRPSPTLRAEQFDELGHRVGSVMSAVQPSGGQPPVRLSSDGVVQVLREFWTGVEAGGGLSETAHGDLPGLKPAADGGTTDADPGGSGGKPGVLDRIRGLTETDARSSSFGPADVNARRKRVDVDDLHVSTLWVTGWPKYPDAGFLRPMLELPGVESDTVLFVGSADRDAKMDELERRIDKAGDEGATDAENGEDASAGDAAQLAADLDRLRDHMRDDGVDASEVSAYVTLRARDRDTLTEYRRTFETAATEAGVSVEVAVGASRQMAGLASVAPTGGDQLFGAMRGFLDRLADGGGAVSKLLGVRTGTRTRTDMPPGAVGAMLPFAGGIRQDHDGTLYGLATTKGDDADPVGMLQVAREKMPAPHRVLVGRSGSGKTFRETVNLIEELVRNPERRLAIIDIAENFDGLVELFDGEKVVLGETTVNPFSVAEGVDLDNHIRLLTDMFHLYLTHHMSGDSADDVRSEVLTAVTAAYERAGITDGSEAGKPSPTVRDFRAALREMSNSPEKYAGGDEQDGEPTEGEKAHLADHADKVLNATGTFVAGGTYDHLVADPDDPDGAADLDARVVLYDMSKFKKSSGPEKGMLTLFVLSQALDLAAAAETDDLVNVVIDEAHDMLGDTGRAGHVMKTLRVARNAGLGVDLLTQASEDFIVDESSAIAQQCPISVWGDMSRQADSETARRLGWTPGQAETIKGGLTPGDKAGKDYSEAMVDVDGDKYRTQFRVGPVAEAVATYDADEDGPFDEYLDAALQDGAEAEAEWNARIDEATDGEEVAA